MEPDDSPETRIRFLVHVLVSVAIDSGFLVGWVLIHEWFESFLDAHHPDDTVDDVAFAWLRIVFVVSTLGTITVKVAGDLRRIFRLLWETG